jgi:hypothetical protein
MAVLLSGQNKLFGSLRRAQASRWRQQKSPDLRAFRESGRFRRNSVDWADYANPACRWSSTKRERILLFLPTKCTIVSGRAVRLAPEPRDQQRLGMMRCLLLVWLSFVSCACAVTHNRPAIVTTAEQAIQLGQKACFPDGWKPRTGESWRAKHRPWRDDIWQVWLTDESGSYNPDGPNVEVRTDGTVGDCLATVHSIG